VQERSLSLPFAQIGPVKIHYRIFGEAGPFLVLTPGGRRGFAEFADLAGRLAGQGFRVLLYDRRNCGLSSISFDASDGESEIWADDLRDLLNYLNISKAFIGGSSSGCRLSIQFYLRNPGAVLGLCLFRVTGGEFAAKELPVKYYQSFIDAARKGGMDAVCQLDHWQERFRERPQDRDILLSMEAGPFIDAMTVWRERFCEGLHLPVLGVSADELGSIKVPSIIIPGNDRIHNSATGKLAHALIPGSILHMLPLEDSTRDLIPFGEWAPYEEEIAQTFVNFMKAATDKA
jgi:pimeloyl-ACP methyl ester carboxylesterase